MALTPPISMQCCNGARSMARLAQVFNVHKLGVAADGEETFPPPPPARHATMTSALQVIEGYWIIDYGNT